MTVKRGLTPVTPTALFSTVHGAAVRAGDAIIDGEMCCLDPDGRSTSRACCSER